MMFSSFLPASDTHFLLLLLLLLLLMMTRTPERSSEQNATCQRNDLLLPNDDLQPFSRKTGQQR